MYSRLAEWHHLWWFHGWNFHAGPLVQDTEHRYGCTMTSSRRPAELIECNCVNRAELSWGPSWTSFFFFITCQCSSLSRILDTRKTDIYSKSQRNCSLSTCNFEIEVFEIEHVYMNLIGQLKSGHGLSEWLGSAEECRPSPTLPSFMLVKMCFSFCFIVCLF